MYSVVLFDLDGTLLNTIDDLAAAGNAVCRMRGWPTHSTEAYKQFVGNGIPKLCQRFSPPEAQSESALAATLADFSAYYSQHMQDATAPYGGIAQLLHSIKAAGVRIGVLTNKENSLANRVVDHYFPGVFHHVQGALPNLPIKPDAAGVRHALSQMNADTRGCLFVGDSNVDIITAKNSGLASCGVLWGFRSRSELAACGPEHLAATPAELQAIILGQ